MLSRFFKYISVFIVSSLLLLAVDNVSSDFQIARVKYSGGGDWYNDPSAEENLLAYVRANTNISVKPEYTFTELSSPKLFEYPMIFLTGHGNLKFTEEEAENLHNYLINGGFLYVDDDYGLDPYIRKEMKKVFPEQEFVELPFSHGIYNCHYKFPQGPPKTHEHDDHNPKGFGLFHDGRLCVYYTFESNPSDGWADERVHNDNQKTRETALQFGTNIIVWALTN